ncbi:MAG: OmpA family protein [Shimia sp.]
MAKIKATAIGALAGLIVLSACAEPDPVYNFNHREAGSDLNEGGFGDPTFNNMMVMTGQRSAGIDMAVKFAEAVPTQVTFAFNSAHLDGAARAILQQQAGFIQQFPEVRFRVFGHTDLVGSEGYNASLGLRRAHAVVNYLAQLGVSTARLEAVDSFGETQPVVPTPNRSRQNRRAVTEVSGFVGNHPTVLQGKYAEVVFREYVESATSQPSLDSAGGTGGGEGGLGGGE